MDFRLLEKNTILVSTNDNSIMETLIDPDDYGVSLIKSK